MYRQLIVSILIVNVIVFLVVLVPVNNYYLNNSDLLDDNQNLLQVLFNESDVGSKEFLEFLEYNNIEYTFMSNDAQATQKYSASVHSQTIRVNCNFLKIPLYSDYHTYNVEIKDVANYNCAPGDLIMEEQLANLLFEEQDPVGEQFPVDNNTSATVRAVMDSDFDTLMTNEETGVLVFINLVVTDKVPDNSLIILPETDKINLQYIKETFKVDASSSLENYTRARENYHYSQIQKNILMSISFILGVVIIYLNISSIIYNRREEWAIKRSIGASVSNLYIQLLIENAIVLLVVQFISFVCFVGIYMLLWIFFIGDYINIPYIGMLSVVQINLEVILIYLFGFNIAATGIGKTNIIEIMKSE